MKLLLRLTVLGLAGFGANELYRKLAPRLLGAGSRASTAVDTTMRPAVDERIGGGPSVLFDAVAIIPGEADAPALADHPGVQAFLADAFAHCKFIGVDPTAEVILQAAGITDDKRDAGFIALGTSKDSTTLVEQCRALRFWEREGALP